jgi:hypothetical protein
MARQQEDPHRTKAAMLAAAHYALEYKRKNPKASDSETIEFLMNNLNSILMGME